MVKEYDQYDGIELAGLVQRGEASPEELLEEAISRAERLNPKLNAIVTPLYSEARKQIQSGLPGGPFKGIPFLLKDIGAAMAGVPMRAGSKVYRDYIPQKHDELVNRYQAAGLVIFGRTNMPEMGILPVTEPELYGPAHNPWQLGHTPGGSSGGAAAAVAARIVPIAHGSDGGGSIRIPAACCGLYGLKPTRGRTPVGSEYSERFFGFSIDHVLTRSVRDSAAMLDISHGPESTAFHIAPTFNGRFLDTLSQAPEKLRIAFTDEPLLPAARYAEGSAAVEEVAQICADLGHTVERARPSIDAHAFARAFFLHFAATVAAELAHAEAVFQRKLKYSDMERATYLLGLVGRSIHAGMFITQRRALLEAQRKVAQFFEQWDVLLTPTLGMAPLPHGAMHPKGLEDTMQEVAARLGRPEILRLPGLLDAAVDKAYGFAPYTPVFNVSGNPSANIPLVWNSKGLPIGTMITGRLGEDARLLRLSAQLEEARPWASRRPDLS